MTTWKLTFIYNLCLQLLFSCGDIYSVLYCGCLCMAALRATWRPIQHHSPASLLHRAASTLSIALQLGPETKYGALALYEKVTKYGALAFEKIQHKIQFIIQVDNANKNLKCLSLKKMPNKNQSRYNNFCRSTFWGNICQLSLGELRKRSF